MSNPFYEKNECMAKYFFSLYVNDVLSDPASLSPIMNLLDGGKERRSISERKKDQALYVLRYTVHSL